MFILLYVEMGSKKYNLHNIEKDKQNCLFLN